MLKSLFMNRKFQWLLTAALWLALGPLSAQTAETNAAAAGRDAYTIIANPGEIAWKQVRINWHADRDGAPNICLYTEVSDTQWKRARSVPAREELCTAYDSIYSKTAGGENFYEQVRIRRCTAELDGLKPGTAYMYRVGPAGTDRMSEVRYFRTAPRSGKWTAGIISDFHSYTPLPNRLKTAMAMLDTLEARNGKPFDLMLDAGDVCAWGGSYSFWKRLYEEPAFARYMWAGVNGNHDNMDRQSERLSNDYFRYANNNPLNGYPGEEGVCYHFLYGNTLLITLNNENMYSEQGLAAAREWVKKVITENPARYVIVMEHYQWFFGDNGRTAQYGRWKDLFDECGVDLAIAGNNHIYVRTNALYRDRETDGTVGTVYVQLPSSDNERGRAIGELTDNAQFIRKRWSEGPKTVGAILLKADNRSLRLTLYDRQGDIVDEVSVLAKRKKK